MQLDVLVRLVIEVKRQMKQGQQLKRHANGFNH